MKPKMICKCSVDLAMTVLLLCQMAYMLIGEAAHEWMGTVMFLLFLLHLYGDNVFEKCGINRDETGDIGKTRYFSGKRQHLRRERPAVYQQS